MKKIFLVVACVVVGLSHFSSVVFSAEHHVGMSAGSATGTYESSGVEPWELTGGSSAVPEYIYFFDNGLGIGGQAAAVVLVADRESGVYESTIEYTQWAYTFMVGYGLFVSEKFIINPRMAIGLSSEGSIKAGLKDRSTGEYISTEVKDSGNYSAFELPFILKLTEKFYLGAKLIGYGGGTSLTFWDINADVTLGSGFQFMIGGVWK